VVPWLQLDGELFVMPSVDTDILSEQTRSTSNGQQEQQRLKSRLAACPLPQMSSWKSSMGLLRRRMKFMAALGPTLNWYVQFASSASACMIPATCMCFHPTLSACCRHVMLWC